MKKIIIWLVIIVVVAIGLSYLIKNNSNTPNNNNSNNASTTNEEVVIPSSWVATTSTSTNISFRYPADLGTEYVHETDWPPMINVYNQKFDCTEAGVSPFVRAGQTELKTIEGQTYCVTAVNGGAAGSVYQERAYAFPYQGDQTLILTFTMQFPQCMNYDDPKQTECKTEEDNFNIEPIIAKIRAQVESK